MTALGAYLKPAARVARVRRRCRFCATLFEVLPSVARRGRGVYCAPACYERARVVRAERDREMRNQPPAPPPAEVVPVVRWPEGRGHVPLRCPRPHCGGVVEVDPPYGLIKWGEARCLMCSRAVARLQAGWGEGRRWIG